MSTFRDSSKLEWQSNLSVEHINAGSLQRIADAVERMATNHVELQNRCERYVRWYKDTLAKLTLERRRTAALRGVITKLKAKA